MTPAKQLSCLFIGTIVLILHCEAQENTPPRLFGEVGIQSIPLHMGQGSLLRLQAGKQQAGEMRICWAVSVQLNSFTNKSKLDMGINWDYDSCTRTEKQSGLFLVGPYLEILMLNEAVSPYFQLGVGIGVDGYQYNCTESHHSDVGLIGALEPEIGIQWRVFNHVNLRAGCGSLLITSLYSTDLEPKLNWSAGVRYTF